MRVSERYLQGVREGRAVYARWLANNLFKRERLTESIGTLERLIVKLAPLANSERDLPFLQGELDFYRNQLKKVS